MSITKRNSFYKSRTLHSDKGKGESMDTLCNHKSMTSPAAFYKLKNDC